MPLINALLMLTGLLHFAADANASGVMNSIAEQVCAPLHDARFQGPNYQARISNCEDMVLRQKVKNLGALQYTIQYFANNFGKLRDSSCAIQRLGSDDQCSLCEKPAEVEKGIRNGCTMVINDIENNHPQHSNRSTGYFIDLCARNPAQNLKTFYVNRGKGHAGQSMYDDVGGRRTTLMGAFLTDTMVQPFSPYSNPGRYQNLCGIRTPLQVRLVGLNATNNDSEESKPMHVSPYESSFGCPSVSCESVPIMKNLAENGPSLVMNYATSRMANAPLGVQSGHTCQNGVDDIDQLARSANPSSIRPTQQIGRDR